MNKVKGTGISIPTHITSIVEKEERERLEEIGWREHLTVSQINRKAIQEYIKNHGSGNDTFKIDQFQDPDFRAMPATMSPMVDWKEFINNNTDAQEDSKLELKCMGIIGVIKEKRKNVVNKK